jgi:hypothetical protein
MQMFEGGLRAHSRVAMMGLEEAEASPSLPCVVLLFPATAGQKGLMPFPTEHGERSFW